MDEPIAIPIGGDNSALLKSIEASEKRLLKLVDAAEAAGRKIDAAIGNGRANGSGVVRGSGRSTQAGSDPFERMDRAILDLHLAKMNGSADTKGLEYRLKKSEEAAAKASQYLSGGQGDSKKAMIDALMTSRLLPGGGLSPIFGKLVKAGIADPSNLGPMLKHLSPDKGSLMDLVPMATKILKTIMPMTEIAAVAAVAADGMMTTRNMASSMFTTGGTGREVAQLKGIGDFLGTDASSRAMALSDRLRGGGYGAAFARANGIVDQGFWTVDKAGNYLKVIDLLRGIKDNTKAEMVARDLGMTEELYTRYLSKASYFDIKNANQDLTPQEIAHNAETQHYRAQVQGWWDNTARFVGDDVFRHVASIGNLLWRDNPINPSSRFRDTVVDWANILDPIGWLSGKVEGWRNAKDKAEGHEDSTNRNTDAVQNLTRTLKDHAESIGLGSRGGTAVAPGMVLNMVNGHLNAQAFQLGAFGV